MNYCLKIYWESRDIMSYEYNQLENEIFKLRDYINTEQGKKDQLISLLIESEDELNRINEYYKTLEQVMVLFQLTSEFARKQAKDQIESLVTKCLQYIFESNIEFLIELEEARNKSNAEFYVINDTPDFFLKTKPEQSRGGGVVDIVSLALRISFLQTHKPPIQGPLILDEPAKHVSEDYIYNVGDFLKQTSEMFNRQIIMVTHNAHLAALSNTAYRVDISGTTSKVTPVNS